jgi:hypothetical protein
MYSGLFPCINSSGHRIVPHFGIDYRVGTIRDGYSFCNTVPELKAQKMGLKGR